MADKIVFKQNHGVSLSLCVHDEDLNTMITIIKFCMRFSPSVLDTSVESIDDSIVDSLNYIIHGDNEAKKLLLFKSLSPVLEKYRMFGNKYTDNSRYDDQVENRTTTALYNVLGKRRPKAQSNSTLKDIVAIMYNHRIKTYEM